MRFGSVVLAVAVGTAAASADNSQTLKPAGNGALDLSHKGLVAVYRRDVDKVHGSQGAKGAVGFRSAMDLDQISKPNPEKRGESGRRSPPADDEPWVLEWSPGDSIVQEVQETESPAAAPSPAPHGHEQATGAAAPAANKPATLSVPSVAQQETTQVPSIAGAPVASSPLPSSTAEAIQPKPATNTPASPSPVPHNEATGRPSVPPVSLPLPTVPSVSISIGKSATTSPPSASVTAPPAGSGNGAKNALTFNIVNKMGGSITISYQLGTYSPATGGATTIASQLLGVSQTTGTFAASTQVVAPFGWAGRMTVGKGGGPLDFRGTKIEGNNGFTGADSHADPDPDVDVSYVDGYSVPASCSCGDTVITGCNKELFDLGNTCSNLVGDGEHKNCVNDPRQIHGPASPFFAPCAKAAYTYDYDDTANWQGKCAGNVINCCIGTDCPAPTRQPAGNSRREVMALIGARKRAAARAA